jgi:hypothetical protein
MIRRYFNRETLFVLIWLIIGVAVNTASPHLPSTHFPSTGAMLHSWVQYVTSIAFWPLSFWHPEFTTGMWTP